MARRRRRRDFPLPTDPAEALDAFDARYEEGDFEPALAIAERALGAHPEEAALHHARGLALWGLGRLPSAAGALRRATELDPSLPDPYLDLAGLLVDHLDTPDDALAVLKASRRALSSPEQWASMHALRGRAFLLLDDPGAAEKELRRARRHAPGDADLAADLAEVRLEGLDLRGAEEMIAEAMRLNPDLGRPHWLRAVLHDRAGDGEAAAREFAAAARLEPEDYFVPERIPEAEFDRLVEKAIAGIPPRFRRHLENAEVAVEAYPGEAFLREHEVSPLVLGLFLGTPMTLRTFEHADLPPRILIFQRNLENTCRTRRELVREIGITVRHEIGHLLGMEEEDLEDAGHA
jgi:predicted Zn-dependent protease with MMP-like domain